MANKTSKHSSKSDERNVVGADQVDIQDLENQLILLWEKNKGLILGGIAFVFAVFIGFQGFKFMQHKAEANLMAGYQEASESDSSLETWAAENEGKALSGFAYKELGDSAYANGDLAKAADYYQKAADTAQSPVADAAKIALASTLFEQGKLSEAKSVLAPIASDPEALNQAEAQYRLAKIASAEGDTTGARDLISSIPDTAFFWKSRAEALEATLPEA